MKTYDIICLQEHWLSSYENSILSNIPNYKATVKCYDDENPHLPTHRPRGYAGIAIIWRDKIDSAIDILPDGSNRLQAIQVQTADAPITIINTYMPAEGSLDQSTNYESILDEVHTVTQKYAGESIILWIGDLNASFNRKKSTRNDKLLQTFCQEVPYIRVPGSPNTPTYHHFSGNAQSQIDHCMQLSSQTCIIEKITIDERNPINLSTHDPVCAKLSVKANLKSSHNSRDDTTTARSMPTRINWKKVDKPLYHHLTDMKLECLINSIDDLLPTDIILERLHSILKTSAEESSTSKQRKVKGSHKPNWPPGIKQLVKESKSMHAKWKSEGSSTSTYSFQQMKSAKRQLRSAQRQLIAVRRNEYFEQIMISIKQDSPKFFSLIKQQHPTSSNANYIEFPHQEDNYLEGWTNYYENLATPKYEKNYNQEMEKAMEFKKLLLEELVDSTPLPPIDQDTVRKYITSLKNNKAPDVYGISSEHMKCASPLISTVMTHVIQTICKTQRIPDIHKAGVLTPIHKKGRPVHLPDSYRRITCIPTTGKIVEKHILALSKPALDTAQNRQQRGFSEGASSINVGFLITEAIAESKDKKEHLFIQYLDAKKAFDVVWHTGMLCNLHDQGITGPLWSLHSSLYQNINSCVKWNGQLSPSFEDQQGLRQGGLTSADSFKARTNHLLNMIEKSPDALHIGSTCIGAPTCADDSALCSKTLAGSMSLLKIAEADSADQRYQFSATKSKIMLANSNSSTKAQLAYFPIQLLDNPMETTENETHLGIQRVPSNSATPTVKIRITTARRSTYAMMGAGLHGLNGLNPAISLQLIKIYIIPRLLYGLEAMILTESDVKMIETYYRTLLKQIQHLPKNTASPAVYLLLGALPAEGHLDLNRLSLFNRLVTSETSLEREIVERQLATKDLHSHSWVATIRQLLAKYELPSAYEILEYPPPKEEWKKMIKEAVYTFWESKLKAEAMQKSTLFYLHIPKCTLKKEHSIYNVQTTDPLQIIMAAIKAKILLQRYPLSSTYSSGMNKSSLCPICKKGSETLAHFLLWCELRPKKSNKYLEDIQLLLQQNDIAFPTCPQLQESWYIQVILDVSAITDDDLLISQVENLSRRYLFQLHHHRSTIIGGGSSYVWAQARGKGQGKYRGAHSHIGNGNQNSKRFGGAPNN